MPPRHQQRQIGKCQPIGQARCQCMPRQMVDPDQRQARRHRQPLGQHHPRQDPTDQPRPGSDRNRINLGQPQPRLRQRAFDTVVQSLDMGARSNLGHNTAERGMQCRLPFDHRRQDGATRWPGRAHNRCCGIIATAFNAQNRQRRVHHPPLPNTPLAGNTKGMATQSRHPAILLTRPADQSARFAAALRDRAPEAAIVISPLMAPKLWPVDLPKRDWQAVIFSSETAVLAARRIIADGGRLPDRAFCVGDQTARAARKAGFATSSADGDAFALIALVRASAPTGPLLYLCGRDVATDIASGLSLTGLETIAVTAYSQEPQSLSPTATALLAGPSPLIAPVFSRRSGALLAAEMSRLNATAALHVVAISQAAAAAFPPDRVTIAAHPDADAMLTAVMSRLNILTPP
jgi:uroporphyrinogen-III synthase